jgi:hypothetical protein
LAIDPEALYVQLGRLVEAMPNFLEPLPLPRSTEEWLGRVGALIAASGDILDQAEFNAYTASLSNSSMQLSASQDVTRVVYRALAKAELKAPAAIQGSFIPAGNSFDAMGAIGKVLGGATQDLLIVDPYMDEKVLTDFAGLAPEHVHLRLLADQQKLKPTLRWRPASPSRKPKPTRCRTVPARYCGRGITTNDFDAARQRPIHS